MVGLEAITRHEKKTHFAVLAPLTYLAMKYQGVDLLLLGKRKIIHALTLQYSEGGLCYCDGSISI